MLVLYSVERAWCNFLKGVWRNEATCIHIVYNNPNRLVYFKIKIVSVDRNFLKSKFSFMLHLLKTNFIKFILSFIYHSIKTIFSSSAQLCCGGGSRVATRIILVWMTCMSVPLVKKIAIETACVRPVIVCVTQGFKVWRCKSYWITWTIE